ncbi:hypothetical protein [Pleionea sp. CnH1-48]|uniref:hypothetical protein n=1 Tax=Pleionea sp. CnH1-48 TaxID=2954494 RepID=UPI0020980433|nr:hypothetical protein [Pleionea sp. CnH1-48]MCO7222730.1 hypothetical protein [Pleionea sp. CnH1-48]
MYEFTNTEINNKKASEFETKSLLYLIGMRADSKEIEILTVDCFNDITGANESFSKLWDVQSKNHKYLPPSRIGESLLTLYKNFISSFDFAEYILFIPKLKRDYLIDPSLNVYGYSNIHEKQRKGIERYLIKELSDKKEKSVRPALLDDFFDEVVFVEDNKKISTYIKKIARFKNKRLVTEELYESIFNDIRDAQSVLKNSYIENEEIEHPSEVLKFNRHITKKQINTLLISRLVGVEVFSFSGVPTPFLPVVKNLDIEDVKDLLQDCNENLSRAFFDKNGCANFWKISEFIIQHVKGNGDDDVNTVYDALLSSVKVTTNYLTKDTILYMISLILTGVENES